MGLSAYNISVALERSPVGLGLRKISQWVKYTEFTDVTTTGSLTMTPTIPAGAFVLGTRVYVKTAFTGGANSTATLAVGKTSGQDEFTDGASSINVYTAGKKGDSPEDPLEFLASATTVYLQITVSADWTTISAGQMLVEIYYLSTEVEELATPTGYPDKDNPDL